MTNERNKIGPTAVEERLAQSLKSHAADFEPSNEAFRRLEKAVRSERRSSRRTTIGRPLLVAAVSIAVLGFAALAMSQRPPAEVASATASGTGRGGNGPASGQSGEGQNSGDEGNAVENAEGSNSQPEQEMDQLEGDSAGSETSEVQTDTGLSSRQSALDRSVQQTISAQEYAPIRATRSDAVRAYLHLIQVNDSEFDSGIDELPSSQNRVTVPISSGDSVIAEVTVNKVANGFVASGPNVNGDLAIDSVDTSNASNGILTVVGSGFGFEGAVSVELYAAGDGRKLATTSAAAGNFGEAKPFVADVPVVGNERVVVVVRPLTPVEDDAAFVATTAEFEGPVDSTNYQVVKVASDDQDGGLVVRDGPAPSFERVAVLKPGADSTTRSNEFSPYLFGTEVWWRVVTADGGEGWVNSAFLASEEPLTASQRIVADEVMAELKNGTYARVPFANWVAIGSTTNPELAVGRDLAAAEAWYEARSFEIDPDSAPFEGSLLDFYQIEGVQNLQEDQSTEPVPGLDGYFDGIESRVFETETSDGKSRRVHLFFEPTPGGMQVIGILREP